MHDGPQFGAIAQHSMQLAYHGFHATCWPFLELFAYQYKFILVFFARKIN